MKAKLAAGILLTLFLLTALFNSIPATSAQPTVTIGIIGPVGLPHWSPGMKEAAEMARDEINDAGGINIDGTYHEIVLKFEDEHAMPTPSPVDAYAAMEKLITIDGCEYIIGGFRTECTAALVEAAADYGVPFIIDGSSTDGLIGDTVGTDYARYKYLFRINPQNSTTLFYTIAGFVAPYLLPNLLPLYGQLLWPEAPNPQVRVAVITEDLEWTLEMHAALTNPAMYPFVLGPAANVTYQGRIPDGTTNCAPWLQGVKDSQARLLIHVFSGVTGLPFIQQWRAMEVQAVPLGINVMGQLMSHWPTTGGDCKYESFLAFGGTRTPVVPGKTEVFWDDFYALTGTWPLYTAWGAYDGIYALKEAFEATGTKDKDDFVAYSETPEYSRQALNGIFKFTSLHDVYSNEYGPLWTEGFVRAFISQWVEPPTQFVGQNVVSPVNMPFSRRFQLPPWMYPISSDLNFDGTVDVSDAITLAGSFGSGPEADPPDMAKWLATNGLEMDIVVDGVIDIFDAITLAGDFGTDIPLPMP